MENIQEYAEQLKKELEEAKAAAAAAVTAQKKAEEEAAAAQEALRKSGAPVIIKGSYKGYSFVQGHARVRDKNGVLCDTQMLIDAANDKKSDNYAAACEVLDHLIKIEYAYFTKAK
jgi:uncharacterized lipoprotein YmbA